MHIQALSSPDKVEIEEEKDTGVVGGNDIEMITMKDNNDDFQIDVFSTQDPIIVINFSRLQNYKKF